MTEQLDFHFQKGISCRKPYYDSCNTNVLYGKKNPGLGIKAGVSPTSIHHCELLGMSVGHSVPQFLHL